MRRILLWICVSLAIAASAAAQDEEHPLEADEVVVSAAAGNESLEEPPAFVETIEMERFAGRFVTTAEALAQAAGVNVQSFGGLGRLATVSIRGAAPEQVVVLVDGVRMNAAAGGGVDLSMIPPGEIERIEIVRGGDAARYGAGAVGGVVNIVTKKATGAARNEATVTQGSYNTWQFDAARAARAGATDYLVSGTFLHTDGTFAFVNDNGTELDERDDFTDVRTNNATNAGGVLVKASRGVGAAVVAAQNEFFQADRGVPGIVTFPSPHAHLRETRDATTASLTLDDWPVAGLSWGTVAAHRYAASVFEDPRGEQTGVPLRSEQREYAPEVEQRVRYVWGRHQIVTLTGLGRGEWLRDPRLDDPQRTTWAAALADQVVLGGELLTLLPAVRMDAVSDTGTQWSPKLGVAVKPLGWLTVKGNAGRSFRAPSFTELYLNQGFVEGNPDLRPERATNYDAGLQLAWAWLFAEAAYFRNEVTDLIEYVAVGGFRYRPLNIGRARLEGLETSAHVEAGRIATLAGNYTLTEAVDETDEPNRRGRQIPGRPRHTGFARATGHAGLFEPFVEFDYVSGNFVTRANTKLLPARRLWNAGLTMAPDAAHRIGFEMKNLTDERIVDVRGFPLPGRSVFVTYHQSF